MTDVTQQHCPERGNGSSRDGFKNVFRYFGGFLTQMLTQPPLQRRELMRPMRRAAETENEHWEHGDFVVSDQQLAVQPDHTLGFLLAPSQTHFSVTQLQRGL